jgi:multiple sugar transport system substrate-binding protein
MALATDLRRGDELAGYRIEALVGRGGMGVVYRALDLRLKRPVALKLIAPALAADAAFRERFLRESELAASLDHSHIVPVYAAGELDGQLWIAMRYVQGEDLRALLEREGPLEPARTLGLLSQVAAALDAAHAGGLVHRDVKPANMLVTLEDGEEHYYLSDFGLARSGEAHPDAGQAPHLSGTPDYTPPEQIESRSSDGRADVYALGCVLYECLAGAPPFRRERAVATLFAHINDPPPSLHTLRPELPEAIDAVLARALAKEPDDRYGSCRELIEASRAALGLRERSFTRRQLVLTAGAGLAVAAAAAVPAILLSRSRSARSLLPLTRDSLVRIDPATGQLTAAIPAPNAAWVGVSGGSVWFMDPAAKRLTRVDPGRNAAVEVFDISAIPRLDLFEAGAQDIWIAKGLGTPGVDVLAGTQALWRFDTRNDSIEVAALRYTAAISDIAVAPGALWLDALALATREEVIVRIDSATSEVVARVSAGPPNGSFGTLLGVGLGSVWLLNNKSLRRIDPRTNTIAATLPTDFVTLPAPDREQGDDIVAGEGAIWFLSVQDGSVSRIDPASGRIVDRVGIGRVPTGLVLGGGALWAASGREGTVTRIDPRTLDTESIRVGSAATSIAAGAGAIWVAVAGPGTGRTSTPAGEGPLKKGLAAGMYGGPTGFPGAERYQYPLDSAEGRAISALRRLRRDGSAPDRLVVQVFGFVAQKLTYPFRKGAPTIAHLFEEETGIKLQLVPVDLDSEFVKNLHNAKTNSFSLDVVTFKSFELGTLAEAGLLRPLDDFVGRHDPQWLDARYGYAGGESTVVKLTRYKGATYAVATDLDGQPYFYRGDLLDDPGEQASFGERYGRELRFPLTWDEQAEVAEFFTRPDAHPPLFGDVATLHPLWGTVNWYQRFVCSAVPNLEYFNTDGSANVAGEAGVRAFDELLRSLAWHPPKAPEEGWFEQYQLMGACSGFGGGSFPGLTVNVVGNPQFDKGCGKWIRSDVMPGRVIDGALVRRPVTHVSLQHGVNAFADQPRQEAAYLFLQWLGGARLHTWDVIIAGGFGIDPLHDYSLDDPYIAKSYRPQPTGQLKNIIPRVAPEITINRGGDYQYALGQQIWDVLHRKRTPAQAAKRLSERWDRITEQAGVETQVEALKTFVQGFPQIVDVPGRALPVEEVSTAIG